MKQHIQGIELFKSLSQKEIIRGGLSRMNPLLYYPTNAEWIEGWWDHHNKFSYLLRIKYFPWFFEIFRNKNPELTELDFICFELKNAQEAVTKGSELPFASSGVENFIQYIKYLSSKLNDFYVAKEVFPNGIKIPFTLPKIDVISLFLLMNDNGITSFRSDYHISKFLTERVMYETENQLKYVQQEIEKIRKSERAKAPAEQRLKEKFGDFKVKITEDIKPPRPRAYPAPPLAESALRENRT